ncbi:MAG: ABC transporter ATP-binding protein [FCB group bacterium]|nr:ABC transporter ATP-binding protein [FCB group bacterium]
MHKPVYRRLLKLVFRYWPYFLASTLAAFVYVILNSASVWLTASLINNILADFSDLLRQQQLLEARTVMSVNDQLKYWTNKMILRDTPMDTLEVLCLAILVVFSLKNLFLYIKNVFMAYVQLRLIQEIRNKLYEHLHTLSLSFFNRKQSGELTSILLNDVANMRRALSTSFQKLFVEPINILTMVTLLFIISWKLALIASIIVPVTGTAIVLIGQSIRRKSRRTAVKIAGITNIVTETLASIRVVKAFVMKDYEVNRFKKETDKHFKLLFRRARLRHLASPITEFLGVIIGVVLLWYGGREVLAEQSLTSEDFIRFILILFSTFEPARRLSNVNVEIQAGVASAERVFAVIDTPPAITDTENAIIKTTFDKEIRFDHVYFHYEGADDRVLQDVSFTIHKGEIVAIVGHSGAGKSTIADLLPRFYDVTEGSITIDGIDIRRISLASLRSLMGVVTQETILFNDTVRNNIAYGDSNVPEEKVRAAAEAANALDFILEMPEGFDTVIGEKGVKLSGGQRQRLAIARALFKNPPILILDEATSSLDTESEKLVQQAIEKLMHNRTVLVIAHRLSTVVNANKIIVLKEGRIVEMGTHQQLMDKAGLYRKLFRIQFGDIHAD